MRKKAVTKAVAVRKRGLSIQAEALPPANTPEELISRAIAKGVTFETLDKLLTMRRELRAEQAKEMFFEALSQFQSECPDIRKSRVVKNKPEKGGGTRYKFAPLGVIVRAIQPGLLKNRLSYYFQPSQTPAAVRVKGFLHHAAGHEETSEFEIPIDPEAYMTDPQKIASAMTYAKRYVLCNLLGIATSDEDDDANTAGEVRGFEQPERASESEPMKPGDPKAVEAIYGDIIDMIERRGIKGNLLTNLRGAADRGRKARDIKQLEALWKSVNAMKGGST